MGSRDRISAIVLLTLSVMVCIGALGYGLGTFSTPGTGFFPFLLGILIGFLSILMLAHAKRGEEVKESAKSPWPGIEGRKKVLAIVAALGGYGFLLEKLGYSLTTFLLFVLLLKGIQPQKWYLAMGVALLASLGSYALFQVGLQVELPRGFLGM